MNPPGAAAPSRSLDQATATLRDGGLAVVIDPGRDLGAVVMAAERTTPERVGFMLREAGTWMCLALTPERCLQLGLEPVDRGRTGRATMPPIDAVSGLETGMTTRERAHTIRTAADPASRAGDIVEGGHVQIFRTQELGVLERRGLAEAGIDLVRLAGDEPAAVICEILNPDGSLAGATELVGYARAHGLPAVTMDELIAYRRRHEQLVENVVTVGLPTAFGQFSVTGYRSLSGERTHLAVFQGPVADRPEVLVAVHAQCQADIFGSRLCSCRVELDSALAAIDAAGCGVVVYLARAPAGDLSFTPGPHRLPDDGSDDGPVARILEDLGVQVVRLANEDPRLVTGLRELGIRVADGESQG